MADREDLQGMRQGEEPPAGPIGPGQLWRRWWWAVLLGSVALMGVTAAFIMTPGGPAASTSLRRLDSAAGSNVPQPGAAAASQGAPARQVGHTPAQASSNSHIPGQPAPGMVHVAPLPPGVKASLQGWAAGHGGAALALVSQQLGVSAQAGGLHLYLTMKQACTQLSTAVTAANAGPPIPYAALQDQYTRALAQLAGAAADCRAGISARANGESVTMTVNQAMLRRARAELAAGASELYAATSHIRLPTRAR